MNTWYKSFFLITSILLSFNSCTYEEKSEHKEVNETIKESDFIGSESCKSCHQEEFKKWDGSHHEQAMKIANSESVIADFDNTSFTINGVKSSFFKKEKDYYVNTQGPDGAYHDYKVAYTFGVEPMQQYLVEFPNGAYQCLLTAWDNDKKEWYDLQPNLEIKHDEWMHWSGGSMRWNTMCADCHSTNLVKGFDSENLEYNTTFSEINVGCEGCHGPSSLHVDFHKNGKHGASPQLFMDKSLTSQALVEKCARCHSRRSAITKKFDFKGHFFDHYNPSLLTAPNYELDGQIKDEDYVYGSFVQSKMYHNGVGCNDCHDVHTLDLIETGNSLCLNCHTPNYNTPEHHFHEIDTKGAQCVNCHMPGKNYMGIDFRRDHSLRVPRPDQSVEYGTPNACNGCHQDKTAEWASKAIIKNYGPDRKDHFSDHLLAGSRGDKMAYHKLINNPAYPEIARATAVNQLATYQTEQQEIQAVLQYLEDVSPLVRKEAVHLLSDLGSSYFEEELKPLLKDSIRLVRNAASKSLKTNSVEYKEELDMNSDFATGQHQLGVYYESQNNMDWAIKSYQKAIEIDNYFNPSRMNLALLLFKQGKAKDAEELYLKVQEQEPEFNYSYYMLGLLYNEIGDSENALKQLDIACEKSPANVKAFYNYILKLQESGNNAEANIKLGEALTLFPYNENLLYLKLINELNSGNNFAGQATCRRLIEVAPHNSKYSDLLKELTK